MSRVIVTGGGGFLGSFLCGRLLDAGHEVLCVDNFLTGMRRNLKSLQERPGFRLLEHDVTEPFEAEADAIYNLACPASPIQYQKNPVHTVKTCVLGALNLLEIARRCGCPILQASTSEVYGDPLMHPQREEYWGHVNPIGERSCYDEGKRCAETLFRNYADQWGVRIKIIRIFNTYGPGMHPCDGRVVSNFIIQALLNRRITLFGDGTQTRSFCYRDDLIDGMIRMMAAGDEITGPVNLGNPCEFTIRELAELVVEITGSHSEFEYLPLPGDDPKQRRPDISLAGRLLDWRPVTDLRRGLEKTVEYFDRLLQEEPELCGL